jgi:hypothetical protein
MAGRFDENATFGWRFSWLNQTGRMKADKTLK